ncbi:HlyD family secretion protein [Maribacter sp. 2307ULW6-5]|uniref:HlyD family secretion protein n=1 Tax=Maribacter sp. 2307ULW6-5 TaxID=3386275 RepID=UPI0039BCCCCA
MWNTSVHWQRQIPNLEFFNEKSLWSNGASWSVVLLLALMGLASLSSYADILVGPAQVFSTNPPIHVIAKRSGQFKMVNVFQHQEVSEGDVLMVMNANAYHCDVATLKHQLKSDDMSIVTFESLRRHYNADLSLGLELQQQYGHFIEQYMQFVRTVQSNDHQRGYEKERGKLSQSKRLLKALNAKVRTQAQRVKLAQDNEMRSKVLLGKGVISQAEFERVQESLNFTIANQQETIGELESAKISQIDLAGDVFDAANVQAYDLPVQRLLLQMQRRELMEFISKWELENLVLSPINGKISLVKPLYEGQYVASGVHLLTLLPTHHGTFIAECQLPIYNSGKLREGMDVFVSLDNFPKSEWGQLRGSVLSFSETPSTDHFKHLKVQICLEDLVSTYGRSMPFRQEMSGNAKIVLEDMSFLRRIGYGFRDIWDN